MVKNEEKQKKNKMIKRNYGKIKLNLPNEWKQGQKKSKKKKVKQRNLKNTKTVENEGKLVDRFSVGSKGSQFL